MNRKTRNYTLFLFAAFLFFYCPATNAQTPSDVVRGYYQACNNKNIDMATAFMEDSIQIIEMNYVLTKNRNEFNRQFLWESAFEPQYKIIDIQETSFGATAKITKTDKRIDFLQDSAIIYKIEVRFSDNLISQIKTTEYVQFNYSKWQARRNSLIEWTKIHHPEIPAFINDMTPQGAKNYVKVLGLHEKASEKTQQQN